MQSWFKVHVLQLNPPPEKALAIMHRLASDPGIIAIMKKVSLVTVNKADSC